jgi:hypothetical protein
MCARIVGGCVGRLRDSCMRGYPSELHNMMGNVGRVPMSTGRISTSALEIDYREVLGSYGWECHMRIYSLHISIPSP